MYGYWISSNARPATIEMTMLIPLQAINMSNYIEFQMSNNPCIPWKTPHKSSCITLLIYYWIQLANVTLNIFSSMLLVYSFLVMSLTILGIKWVGAGLTPGSALFKQSFLWKLVYKWRFGPPLCHPTPSNFISMGILESRY